MKFAVSPQIIALFVIIGTSDGVGVGLGKSIRAFVKNDFYHPNPKLSSHIRFIKYHSEEPDLGQHVQPEQKGNFYLGSFYSLDFIGCGVPTDDKASRLLQ